MASAAARGRCPHARAGSRRRRRRHDRNPTQARSPARSVERPSAFLGSILMRATTRLPAFFLTLGLALLSREASAFEWELDVDGRLVSSNGQKSAMSGGLGELRFGESKSGVQLGRAR